MRVCSKMYVGAGALGAGIIIGLRPTMEYVILVATDTHICAPTQLLISAAFGLLDPFMP